MCDVGQSTEQPANVRTKIQCDTAKLLTRDWYLDILTNKYNAQFCSLSECELKTNDVSSLIENDINAKLAGKLACGIDTQINAWLHDSTPSL